METLRQQVNSSGLGQMNRADEALIKALVPILDGLILVTGLVGQTLVITILTGRRRKGSRPPHGTDTLLIALFLCGFALPLGIIVAMYAKIYCFLRHTQLLRNAPQLERYQSQVTHTSALLVLVFTLLWLPSYALMFSFIGGTITGSHGFNTIAILARLLASSVAVVNPILYGFMSQKFRRDLIELGRERWACCKSCLIGCPDVMGRDVVQPFELDSTSERGQN
uniref:G-protein coupled receptors family 1 profile domain-containing protein n=1 Tax=Sander lucioperca TaxID=283035 RepID=A0A8D0AMY7_SANLU